MRQAEPLAARAEVEEEAAGEGVQCDEARFAELGRRAVEMHVVSHIFLDKLAVSRGKMRVQAVTPLQRTRLCAYWPPLDICGVDIAHCTLSHGKGFVRSSIGAVALDGSTQRSTRPVDMSLFTLEQAAFSEAESIRRQDALIREEEQHEAESDARAALKAAADRERRARKKQRRKVCRLCRYKHDLSWRVLSAKRICSSARPQKAAPQGAPIASHREGAFLA